MSAATDPPRAIQGLSIARPRGDVASRHFVGGLPRNRLVLSRVDHMDLRLVAPDPGRKCDVPIIGRPAGRQETLDSKARQLPQVVSIRIHHPQFRMAAAFPDENDMLTI